MFGGTIGGPVWIPNVYKERDCTWFHFVNEDWRYRRAQQQISNVPTDAERAGDFSNSVMRQPIYDPATTAVDPTNSQRFLREPTGNAIKSRPQISGADTLQVKIDHRSLEQRQRLVSLERSVEPADNS